MSQRTASTVSLILNIVLLLIFAVLTIIFEMIVLNGASERQGLTAISLTLVCLGAGAILLGILAWKATGFFIAELNWNPILAVTLTVALGMLVSGMIAIVTLLLSVPLAGIR